MTTATAQPNKTIFHDDLITTATKAGDFKQLLIALTAAGLVETLKGPGPFTIFAPSDDAFAKLDKKDLADLLKPENKAKLAAILKLHIVDGQVFSAAVGVKLVRMKSLHGDELAIDPTVHGVTVNKAKVTQVDIKATNGVIHVIDSVLMPT